MKVNCPIILPTVYDDSLSYYEMLCKLTEVVNELIDTVNELVEKVEGNEED